MCVCFWEGEVRKLSLWLQRSSWGMEYTVRTEADSTHVGIRIAASITCRSQGKTVWTRTQKTCCRRHGSPTSLVPFPVGALLSSPLRPRCLVCWVLLFDKLRTVTWAYKVSAHGARFSRIFVLWWRPKREVSLVRKKKYQKLNKKECLTMNDIFLVIPVQIWAACVGAWLLCIFTQGFWKQLPLPDRQALLPPRTLQLCSLNPQILLGTSKLSQWPSSRQKGAPLRGSFPGTPHTHSLSGGTS